VIQPRPGDSPGRNRSSCRRFRACLHKPFKIGYYREYYLLSAFYDYLPSANQEELASTKVFQDFFDDFHTAMLKAVARMIDPKIGTSLQEKSRIESSRHFHNAAPFSTRIEVLDLARQTAPHPERR
jgi:hypothetical protein